MKLSEMSLQNLQIHNQWATAEYIKTGRHKDYLEWVRVYSAMLEKENKIK